MLEYVDSVFVAAHAQENFSATLIHIFLAFFPLSDGCSWRHLFIHYREA